MALTDNLLAYWPLDKRTNGSLSLIDSTTNTYDLTAGAGVVTDWAKIGGGALFNSSTATSYLFNNTIEAGQTWTVSCWVKFSSISNDYPIAVWGTGNDYGDTTLYLIQGAKTFRIYSGNSGATDVATNITPTIGEWYHTVAVFSATSIKLYINGTLAGEVALDDSVSDTSFRGMGISEFLGEGHPGDYEMDGAVDDVAVWARALTVTEVGELYNGGDGISLNTLNNGLLAYWPLNTLSNVYDRVGTNNLSSHLETVNFTNITSKLPGGCSVWDTSYERLEAPTSFSLQSFTVSAWIKQTYDENYHCIAHEWNDASGYVFFFGINDQGNLFGVVTVAGIAADPIIPITDGKWHHVAMSYDPITGNLKLYADGTEVGSATFDTNPLASATGNFTIGSDEGADTIGFNGCMSDVGLWNRVLSIDELRWLYNRDAGNQYPFQAVSLPARTVYFVGHPQGNGYNGDSHDFSDITNWHNDMGTVLHGFPDYKDSVVINNNVTLPYYNNGSRGYIFNDVMVNNSIIDTTNAHTPITATGGNIVLNDGAMNDGKLLANTVVFNSSYNSYTFGGQVFGDAEFNNSSRQVFNGQSFPGAVYGNATFNNISENGHNDEGTRAYVGGNATFNGGSANAGGTVGGTGTFYYPSPLLTATDNLLGPIYSSGYNAVNSLVAYWKMDEEGGTRSNSSQTMADLALYVPPTFINSVTVAGGSYEDTPGTYTRIFDSYNSFHGPNSNTIYWGLTPDESHYAWIITYQLYDAERDTYESVPAYWSDDLNNWVAVDSGAATLTTTEILNITPNVGYGDGHDANAAIFSGVASEYLNNTGINFGYEMSVSAWVRFSGASLPTTPQAIWSLGAGAGHRAYTFYNNRKIYSVFAGPNSQLVSNNSLQNISGNTWYHFVTTLNPTGCSFYVNGVLKGSIKISGVKESNFSVGNNALNYGDYPLKGAIDDVGFWGKALTYSEVTGLYAAQNIETFLNSFQGGGDFGSGSENAATIGGGGGIGSGIYTNRNPYNYIRIPYNYGDLFHPLSILNLPFQFNL